MDRGKTLLDKAAKNCGSFYALSKATGIPQPNMTRVMQGKRDLPMEWVPVLADIAGADLHTELALVLAEQMPEGSRGRSILEKARATGAVATLLFSLIVAVSLTPGRALSATTTSCQLDNLYIVERWLRLLRSLRQRLHGVRLALKPHRAEWRNLRSPAGCLSSTRPAGLVREAART